MEGAYEKVVHDSASILPFPDGVLQSGNASFSNIRIIYFRAAVPKLHVRRALRRIEFLGSAGKSISNGSRTASKDEHGSGVLDWIWQR
jgi:hypothetical protein